ncbi:SPW repeat domain-containing protein [Roseibium sp.]|uniref:SPW repeat domain-containing protein n=1 Tax=Roseibium sp. TaxID=1936156 RepID=UPI003B5017C9
MNIRFVTKTIHAYLDYPVAIGLIALPMLLGLGQSNPLAFWLSVTTGVAALILTILTDHETGLIRVLPYSFHLIVDFAVGVVFLAAPFVLGFKGIDLAYYVVNALAVLTVVTLHKPETGTPQAA